MGTHVESLADVRALIEELHRSREAASSSPTGTSTSVATMNLIVFVDDPVARERVLERAAGLADKHPARTILLDATGKMHGANVATSTRDNAGTTVITERIDVDVRGQDPPIILNAVGELTVRDVSTVLWWSGARLLESRTFSGLAELASTVIVDSSGRARDAETIRELGEFFAKYPRIALHDLAFMRLAPWMDMIAQFFDDPALHDDLFNITEFAIASGSDAEAYYLAGWLASRLSWEPAGRDRFRARGRTIRFSKIAKGDARRVQSVTLSTGDSQYAAELCADDPTIVCLCVTGAKAKPTWSVPLLNVDNLSLMERAILSSGKDHIFETSLLTVREVLA